MVDNSDFHELSQYKWCAQKGVNTHYAMRGAFGKAVAMHRQIMGFPDCSVDHKDGNGLNNQRENLRLATKSQQGANQQCRNPFGKGVWKRGNCWVARVGFSRKVYYLGSFSTRVEAAQAYDRAALKFFGEFAVTNNNNNKGK